MWAPTRVATEPVTSLQLASAERSRPVSKKGTLSAKSFIVELVGPPGAGKSTLAQEIIRKRSAVRAEFFPYFRNARHIPFFAVNMLLSLPFLLRLQAAPGRPTSRDIALITILSGWSRVLRRSHSGAQPLVVLEEGGVCLLSKLRAFGSRAILHGKTADRWWENTYRKWAHTLDLVVCLDPPLSILHRRLQEREPPHETHELPCGAALEYLERIRTAQQQVIAALRQQSSEIQLLCFNSEVVAPASICEATLALADRPFPTSHPRFGEARSQ